MRCIAKLFCKTIKQCIHCQILEVSHDGVRGKGVEVFRGFLMGLLPWGYVASQRAQNKRE